MPSEYTVRSAQRLWNWGWDNVTCGGARTWEPRGTWANSSPASYERFKNWTRTPGYRTLKAQGKYLPDNSFSWEERRVCDMEIPLHYTEIVGTCTGNPNTVRLRYYTDYLKTVYLPYDQGQVYLSDASLRAKLIDRAKGAEWSVPVFFGEARETVGMVLGAARTLGSAYRNLRRGNILGAFANLGVQGDAAQVRRYNRRYGRDPSGAASNAWLGLTYGWTPLLHDVYNAAETLAETATLEENREMRVTAVTRMQDSRITQNVGVASSPQITVRKIRIQKESRRGVWRFKPTNWNVAGSFGLLNPASVAWELVPLSFVVDWFLPIGRYLEGLDVPMRFQHLGGTLGYRRETQTLYDNWHYYGQASAGQTYKTVHTVVSRTPLTSHPTVGLDSIVFEPKLGAPRIASAMALLRQTMTR